MFKYLTYVSRQSHVISDKDLKELLQKSRSNNHELEVTGMLIYFDGIFIQYLEGKAAHVDNIFEKIAKDKRHHAVTELDSGSNNKRAFSDWSMAFKRLKDDEAALILGYKDLKSDKLFEPTEDAKSHPALSILNNYVKNL